MEMMVNRKSLASSSAKLDCSLVTLVNSEAMSVNKLCLLGYTTDLLANKMDSLKLQGRN